MQRYLCRAPRSRYVRGALARTGRPPAGPESYDLAYVGSLVRAAPGIAGIRAAELDAAALWATLEGTPEPLRGKLIASDQRFHTWALAARFLDAAAETHSQDTPARLAACRLALAIAERLPAAPYPAGACPTLFRHPQSSAPLRVRYLAPGPMFSQTQRAEISMGAKRIFLYCEIEYTDSFDKRWKTCICFWRDINGQWYVAPEHTKME